MHDTYLLTLLTYGNIPTEKKDVGKSAVTATEFTIEDQYLSKCSKRNFKKKYEANRFLQMFYDTGKSFSELKLTLNRENDSSGIVDSCPGCGRPHSAYPIAKNSEAKDHALIFIARQHTDARY